jgi:acetyl esterase
MPLDRQANRILRMLAAAGSGTAAFTPEGVRTAMLDMARALDPAPAAGVAVDDLVIAAEGRDLPVRRYAPQAATDGGPGLLYFHGGIGVFGSIRTHDAVCRMICADAGIVVLSLDYRLAPEWPQPAALDDAWVATRWARDHAHRLGIGADHLAVGGDSAGATLATVVCRRARDAGGPPLAAQLLLCPVTDLCAQGGSRAEFADGYFPPAALLQWALDCACPAGVDRAGADLSPLRGADLARLPPAHVHTAGFDPFRDEGVAYAKALLDAGVLVRHVNHETLTHHFYGMAGAVPAARAALRDAAAEFGRELRR